ncbi:MAG TPA: phosphatase PAP2 family protein [Gaiellaceae bacterium]|nr:phosphatase PAP2 family protein [Gaiellaceae bacterium]
MEANDRIDRLTTAVRWAGPAAYIIALALEIHFNGVPWGRARLIAWIALGLVLFSLATPRRLPRLVLDWAPLAAILLIYDLLRGYADGLLFPAHTTPQIDADQWIFGKPVPTVWLQDHLWHGAHHLHWWDYASWVVYLSHFVATLVVAASLWLWAHDKFARYAQMVCVLALMGFATYVLFPAVPPWMASSESYIDHTQRIIGVVWAQIPIGHFSGMFQKGQRYANNVAAMPSLHAGYSMLITLYLWSLVPRWCRVLLVLYPLAMAFALVYSAEHYVIDCLVGWVYAAIAFAGVQLAAARSQFASPEPALVEPS